jgi:transcriptional regulator with XRE-family HTH domain
MKITSKIRELRIAKNISQEYMADLLKVNTSSYHRIEYGISPLTIDRLVIIATALESNVFELLSLSEGDSHMYSGTGPKRQPFQKHLEDEITYLRKQLQEKEHQISILLKQRETVSPLMKETRIQHPVSNWR